VRLEWKQVLSAEGTGGGLVTSIARLDDNAETTRLAQVLDVEQILRDVLSRTAPRGQRGHRHAAGHHSCRLRWCWRQTTRPVARMMIEQGLKAMNMPVRDDQKRQGSLGAAASHAHRSH